MYDIAPFIPYMHGMHEHGSWGIGSYDYSSIVTPTQQF
jgi:hypothetical protein